MYVILVREVGEKFPQNSKGLFTSASSASLVPAASPTSKKGFTSSLGGDSAEASRLPSPVRTTLKNPKAGSTMTQCKVEEIMKNSELYMYINVYIYIYIHV